MTLTRRQILATAIAAAAVPASAQDSEPISQVLQDLLGFDQPRFDRAIASVAARGGTDMISSLIFLMPFTYGPREKFDIALQALTREKRTGWFNWMLWQEAHPEVVSNPAYYPFKTQVLTQIDQNFADFLSPKYVAPDAARIRYEEVTWGGVVKDGIPSLDNPDLIAAAKATYLRDDDLVFGVSINGDTRAYPLRIMGWHEMFNEVIGGVPVALAYCTLCGSGILFETKVAGQGKPMVFGSSGFLYRSNKLMFDRGTSTLWNQFTGEPVMGKLAHSGIALQQRPVTIAAWSNWKRDNPATQVLNVETGHRRNYSSGHVYKEYFASADLMFPAAVDTAKRAQKDYVFGIRQFGAAKAWPLDAFKRTAVINDRAGAVNIVLIGDPDGRTVRAYERGELEFGADLTAGGAQWTRSEDALSAPDGRTLPRVAGHIAYWFAWDNYVGDAGEVYGG
jgi:hypothetical protein